MTISRREVLRLTPLTLLAGADLACRSSLPDPFPHPTPPETTPDPYAPRLLIHGENTEFPRLFVNNLTVLRLSLSPPNIAFVFSEFLPELHFTETNPLKPQILLTGEYDSSKTDDVYDQFTFDQTYLGRPLIRLGLGSKLDIYTHNSSHSALEYLSQDISYLFVYALSQWGIHEGIYTQAEADEIRTGRGGYLSHSYSTLPRYLMATVHPPHFSA